MLSVSLKLKKSTVFILLLTVTAVAFLTVIRLSVNGISKPVGASAADLPEYFRFFGIEVDEGSAVHDNVTVPYEFSSVYESYNKLQKSGGFNLEDYRGQTLERVTYKVTNYPEEETAVYVEALIKDGLTVAADVFSTNVDGFMKPLK